MLPAQLRIDFVAELRKLLPGWRYCPCGQPVSLADEPAFAVDYAGEMRVWHRACRNEVAEHDRRKRMNRG